MANIGVDLDGVCYSFSEDSRIVVANHRGIDPLELEVAKVWDFMKIQWGMEYDDYWKIWYEDVARDHDGGWLRLPPEPGTVEGLNALRDAGHTIHIMTYRKGGEINTMKWIHRYEIPYDGLHIGRDKRTGRKSPPLAVGASSGTSHGTLTLPRRSECSPGTTSSMPCDDRWCPACVGASMLKAAQRGDVEQWWEEGDEDWPFAGVEPKGQDQ
jgi:hypothetical protein